MNIVPSSKFDRSGYVYVDPAPDHSASRDAYYNETFHESDRPYEKSADKMPKDPVWKTDPEEHRPRQSAPDFLLINNPKQVDLSKIDYKTVPEKMRKSPKYMEKLYKKARKEQTFQPANMLHLVWGCIYPVLIGWFLDAYAGLVWIYNSAKYLIYLPIPMILGSYLLSSFLATRVFSIIRLLQIAAVSAFTGVVSLWAVAILLSIALHILNALGLDEWQRRDIHARKLLGAEVMDSKFWRLRLEWMERFVSEFTPIGMEAKREEERTGKRIIHDPDKPSTDKGNERPYAEVFGETINELLNDTDKYYHFGDQPDRKLTIRNNS